MHYRFLFALFAVAAPLVACSYAPVGGHNAVAYPNAGSLNEIVHAAAGSHQAAQSITANADVQPSPADAARLGHVQSQVQSLSANPTYNSVTNSETIAESLAESHLQTNLRHGNVNIVPPNVVEQDVHRSMLVPTGQNNHQVIATQPLPPIIVNQPGAPPAQVSSGPAAIVRAAPVIYKLRPSVIFQQEVINKVPTPLSLNPVYVKVYKPGKQVSVPTAPVVQQTYQNNYQNSYSNNAAPGAGDAYGAAAAPSYGAAAPAYSAAAPAYGAAAPAPAYGAAAPAPAYGAAAPALAYSSSAPAYSNAGSNYNAASSGYGQQAAY